MRTTMQGMLRLAFVSGLATSAPLNAEAVLPCRPHLVSCNYADHFSGTIHYRSKLQDATDDVTATIVDGKATCRGTMDGKAIQGAGAAAVERGGSMEDAPGTPWYAISLSCPGPDGKVPNIDSALIKTYPQKDTSGFKSLAGKVEEDHPDADPVNGVTGTVQIDWSISRKGDLRP